MYDNFIMNKKCSLKQLWSNSFRSIPQKHPNHLYEAIFDLILGNFCQACDQFCLKSTSL